MATPPPPSPPPSTSSPPPLPSSPPPPPPSSSPPPLPSSPPPLRPAALPQDIIEQILLRFPPGEPASLFRAALISKRWCRLVSDPGFHRRFCEFHRTPPTLGLLCNSGVFGVPHCVPTTAFCPHHAEHGHGYVMDARHGRVLLRGEGRDFVVWDPITHQEWKLCFPPQGMGMFSSTATVLCSAAAGAGACYHLDCHRQPFAVVFGASFVMGLTYIYTYSSNAAAWSEPTCGERPGYLIDPRVRSALVGNTLYFGNITGNTILKYNMQLRQMSWIQLPSSVPHCTLSALTTTEDGELQLSIEDEEKLYTWSTKDDARWEQNRVVQLNTLLPDDVELDNFVFDDADLTSPFVVGSTDDLSTIFVSADKVSYAIDLKTDKVKVYEGMKGTIIPYTSFYTPELEVACTGDKPSAGGSNASQS